MAAPSDNLPGPLKYQTWTLKVPIHCEGCKKKVKKILQRLEGVYMTTIDAQQHKVTVTGSIDAQTLLHKLSKSGKPAELWGDNSVKSENVVEAPNSAKEKIKPTKESDGKNKNQKAQGKVTEGVGQKKEKKSADNQANPVKAVKGGEVSEKAAPPLDDGDKAVQLENAGGGDGVDGKSNGNNADKKKKKKGKGNNGNAGNDEKSKAPPASTPPPVSVPKTAPVPPETPALAPTPAPTESPIPAESPVPAETQTPAPTQTKAKAKSKAKTPTSAPAPAQAQAPESIATPTPAPAPAPAEGFSGNSMHQGNPIEPMNFGPSNNYGPPNQDYPNGPYQIPNNFGPPDQQNYMYPPAHYPQPQLGMSYSMAQPSSSTSYYAPPYYAYEYPQYHTMHIPPPPPPSNPINDFYHDDQYYNDNADASRCSLM